MNYREKRGSAPCQLRPPATPPYSRGSSQDRDDGRCNGAVLNVRKGTTLSDWSKIGGELEEDGRGNG